MLIRTCAVVIIIRATAGRAAQTVGWKQRFPIKRNVLATVTLRSAKHRKAPCTPHGAFSGLALLRRAAVEMIAAPVVMLGEVDQFAADAGRTREARQFAYLKACLYEPLSTINGFDLRPRRS
jgi:hypothetical protein